MSTDRPGAEQQKRPLPELDAVFVDRDGTLTVSATGRYVLGPDELRLLPGAAEAVALLNQCGVEVHVVTNQRCVALGLLDPRGLDEIHQRLRRLLAARGAMLDSIAVCPHDEGTCDCRKPRDGLLRRVLDQRPYLRPEHCAVVGDAPTDVRAGSSLGLWRVLLAPDGSSGSPRDADWQASDLLAAVRRLLAATTPDHNAPVALRSAVASAHKDMPGG